MKSGFIYSDNNKRYHTWNYHLQQKFGSKVFKVALNGGFTCPNIDGSKGVGGCAYCSGGSGAFAGNPDCGIIEQFHEIKNMMHKKWEEGLYIPYFQANTNTYAPAEVLREKFEPVLKEKNVVGLSIATRADALEDDVLEYLSELNQRTYLTVELGLQTTFDETGERINRCHTYDDFLTGYGRLTERNIKVCVHLINGLPDETEEMMLTNARRVALLMPYSVKIHLLHILRNTRMESEYLSGKIRVMELDEYVRVVCGQLRCFHPDTVIQRLTGDGGRDELIAPLWSLKKFVVLNEIDKYMQKYNIFQGDRFDTLKEFDL